jgi:hypothetical protein
VRIVIDLDGSDPPTGVVAPMADKCDTCSIEFTGWLDLMQVLAELLSPAETDERMPVDAAQ